MLLRHKVPTIFNIYMLDVICCALGCVILLWQVSHQEAEQQTDAAKKQSDAAVAARLQYEKARTDLLSASNDVTHLQAELADWQRKYMGLTQALAMTEKEREEARKLAAVRKDVVIRTQASLTLSEDRLKKLEADLEKLLASNTKSKVELTGLVKLNAELLTRIALSEKEIGSLKTEVATKQADITAAAKKRQEQLALLKLSDENARKLQRLLDALRDDNKDTQNKLKLTELQLKVREQDLDKSRKQFLDLANSKDKMTKELALGGKDLVDAKTLIAALTRERDQWKEKGLVSNAALGTLKLEKDKLNQRVIDLQAEVEQRFAGIPLTGENVIFLIDISGSMVMKDENTEDPEKWPFLCETLMKLMKSIPTMQRFQIILFSDKTSYLFGSRDSWFKYEGPQSAKLAHDALRKVKVEGGTNMQDAFEEVFRYRKKKLDTVYLFSDGLPNIGDGVPATIRNPTEAQRSFYMGKFVRDKLKNEWNLPLNGQKEVRINAVGFFFESPDVGAFLWAMAREHRGSFVGLR
jgi:von Willebrand factor type A domain